MRGPFARSGEPPCWINPNPGGNVVCGFQRALVGHPMGVRSTAEKRSAYLNSGKRRASWDGACFYRGAHSQTAPVFRIAGHVLPRTLMGVSLVRASKLHSANSGKVGSDWTESKSSGCHSETAKQFRK
jgi:hypothetical protein